MAIHTFAEMVALAQSEGGRCLSAPSEFVDTKSVLRFTCAAGHEWTTRVTNLVHRGWWCPECGAAHSPALTLTDIKRMAADRGGECAYLQPTWAFTGTELVRCWPIVPCRPFAAV